MSLGASSLFVSKHTDIGRLSQIWLVGSFILSFVALGMGLQTFLQWPLSIPALMAQHGIACWGLYVCTSEPVAT
jgi:uncharacterized membrane protein YdfJ with MMPL/SSD domain